MKKILLLSGLFSAFLFSPMQAQREVLVYDIYANKARMGKWEVSRSIDGDLTIYESRREVVFKFLKTLRTVTTQRSVYREDTLLESRVEVIVNGEPRRTYLTRSGHAGFFYREEGKPEQLLEVPVTLAQLHLFFEMPDGPSLVYFDRSGDFLPLQRSDHNSCIVTLSNGEQNEYHYLDGRLTRATMEDGILHTYLRLRKQRERGEVGR